MSDTDRVSLGTETAPAKLVWRAVCGVDGSRWTAQMHDDDDPPPGGTFCPDCRERGLSAPGVLHWQADPPKPNIRRLAERLAKELDVPADQAEASLRNLIGMGLVQEVSGA